MNFTCKKCGNCCRWEGYIYVNRGDVERICDFLQIDRATFRKEYLNPEPHILPNLKLKENSECIFLKENKCSIYEVRPQQCEDFPLTWEVPNLKDRCSGVVEETRPFGE